MKTRKTVAPVVLAASLSASTATLAIEVERSTEICRPDGQLIEPTVLRACALAIAAGYWPPSIYDPITYVGCPGEGECNTSLTGVSVGAQARAPTDCDDIIIANGPIHHYPGFAFANSSAMALGNCAYLWSRVSSGPSVVFGLGPTVFSVTAAVASASPAAFFPPQVLVVTDTIVARYLPRADELAALPRRRFVYIPRVGQTPLFVQVALGGIAAPPGFVIDTDDPLGTTVQGTLTYTTSSAVGEVHATAGIADDDALDVSGDHRFNGADAEALSQIVGTPQASLQSNLDKWDFSSSGLIDADDVAFLQSLLAAGLSAGIFGDANNDGVVNCLDNCLTGSAWGSSLTSTNYRVQLDFNLDGLLDASDEAAFYALNPCPADFNQNGAVSVQDLFDFQNAWFANLPEADFNQNGSISVQDLFDFQNAWFGAPPCP